jgi:hypothetical protein
VGARSWKIGPDGVVAPDGSRLPSEVWCAVGLYPEREDAEAALDDPGAFLPFLGETTEAWHALLLPVAHHGECTISTATIPARCSPWTTIRAGRWW